MDSLKSDMRGLIDLESTPFFKTKMGVLHNTDALKFLASFKKESVEMIFSDPPYNIGKADWDNFKDMESYLEWIEKWVTKCHDVLKADGTLFIMGFPENLAEIKAKVSHIFPHCRWLTWHYRNKPRLSNKDWVRSSEGILHLRKNKDFTFKIDAIREPYNIHTKKYPKHPQAESSQYGNGKKYVWKPHYKGAKPRDVIEIPAINNAMKESTGHPTQKPEALMRKLILATTNQGEIVLDPFGGSGTTYAVCEQLGRYWAGSELNRDYCEIIKKRLEEMPCRSLSYWLSIDEKQRIHRTKVRLGKLLR